MGYLIIYPPVSSNMAEKMGDVPWPCLIYQRVIYGYGSKHFKTLVPYRYPTNTGEWVLIPQIWRSFVWPIPILPDHGVYNLALARLQKQGEETKNKQTHKQSRNNYAFIQYEYNMNTYVCMYVSIYVCMYVSMYVCMYLFMYVWMYVCMYACM